ncbi:glycosyltransferase [Anabaena sp. UHCC 0204]|uniref:glycosyltransferase n=1 Tax=Anabaena sp. UHCC 0204 TaxID=2590009 RepID=UPI00144581AF|nr:glycosyltransferase [Anabaena sp. UHCC 0204]MTJ08640.1 glycosyltransferase [Anabaena sp. UHCC 0204]
MKVVQISTWNVPCGIAGYTKGLLNGIKEHQVECDVIPIDRQALKYMPILEMKEYFISLTDRLDSYDVIHIQHEFSFFAGSYGMNESIEMFSYFIKKIIKLKKKVFVTFHSEPVFPSYDSSRMSILQFAKSKILKQKWNFLVASVFNSNSNLRAIIHTKKSRRIFIDCGFDSKILLMIKQGITFSMPSQVDAEEKKAIKEKIGFPVDSVLISLFGFIAAYKGYQTALETIKKLPQNYYLLIIGSSHPYGNDKTFNEIITYLNRNKKLQERIKLTGYLPLEKLEEYYKAVDICLAPYKGDTNLSSSAAITWALTSGKPVIASKIDAFEELNEEANCLSLITPDAPAELAYNIQSLFGDSLLQNNLVNNALKYCEKNQWKNIAKKHIDIYSA